MTLRQLLSILRSRWPIALTTLLTVVVLVLLGSMLVPKRFTAVAQVLVDAKSPDPVAGILLPPQLMPGYMSTQIDIVGSRSVAEMVVDQLRLDEADEFTERWRNEANGQGSVREFVATALLARLDVKPVKDSSVLNIGFTGTSARQAAEVANAFAQAYIARTIDMRTSPARESHAFFNNRIEDSRKKLETSQARLSAYQRVNGITSTDERYDVENARLSDLSAQLTVLQNQLSESERRRDTARAGQASGGLSQVPEVVQNPVIQALKADQARLEARQRERGAVLGANHPEALRGQAELDALKARIAEESRTIVGSADRGTETLRAQERDLSASIARQRARVLQIRQQRDELATLQRELEGAQRNFDQVNGRLSQTDLESKSTLANVMMLTPAIEPLRPSRPNLLLNGALAGLLGLGAGGWAAVGAELRRRRIRSADDLMQSVDLPVLARIRRLPDADRLRAAPVGALGMGGAGALRLGGASSAATDDGAVAALTMSEAAAAGAVPATVGSPAGAAGLTVRPARKRLGEILMDAGLLTEEMVEATVGSAVPARQLFGEAAVAAGLITELQLKQALAFQFDYPVFLAGGTQVSREVIAAHDSKSIVADFRKLRTQVMARWQKSTGTGQRNRILAIVSPSKGDGKTFIAANLAVTFSQVGQRTLLIDGDLRHGRVHALFGLENRAGLTGILNGGSVDAGLQHVGGLRNLAIICAGMEAPNPSDLLSRDVLETLLAELAQTYDVVIVDTPNAAEDPDASLIARCADGAVVVGRANRTAFEAIQGLTEEIVAMGIPVVGSAYVDA